ncbi:hypothetical protein CsSME_00023392 [Camellia sinensis var. sinensis]
MEARKEEELVEVIHSWSAPRSLSTVLMYSFAQRDDIEVLDEPLYANFLHVTGVGRPYREEVLSKMESDGNKVVKDIIFGPGENKYRFCKVTISFSINYSRSLMFHDLLQNSVLFFFFSKIMLWNNFVNLQNYS